MYLTQVKGYTISAPLPRLTYAEAMERYGCDKPDTRYGLELKTVSPALSGSTFRCAHRCRRVWRFLCWFTYCAFHIDPRVLCYSHWPQGTGYRVQVTPERLALCFAKDCFALSVPPMT